MKTVLLVDDEFDIRDSVRELLEIEGYRVITATNGKEALQALRTQPVDLVLLDLMMPVMDGRQFLTERRTDSEASRVPVLLTSASEAEDVARSFGVEFIRKPFPIDDLLNRLSRTLAVPAAPSAPG